MKRLAALPLALALALALAGPVGADYPTWTACGPTNFDPVCLRGTWSVINYNSFPAAASSSRTNPPVWSNPYSPTAAPVVIAAAATVAPVQVDSRLTVPAADARIADFVPAERFYFTPRRGPV